MGVLALTTALVMSLLSAPSPMLAPALAGGDDIDGSSSSTGSVVNLVGSDSLRDWSEQALFQADTGPWFEYDSVSVCGGHPDRPGSDSMCLRAVVMCQSGVNGDGPAVAIFRRELERNRQPMPGAAGRWTSVGFTCFPALVPGARNTLTMAMIREAFHNTDFTVPTVNIQPEGDLTLVNLPTFIEAKFPESGFGPGEIDAVDPARMLGHRVEVRPVLKSITYHLGGQTVGPTTSMGGPYPNGDVRATYSSAGTHEVRADIVYTGQFRVGGSDWFDIPGEVDLTGTPVTLTVAEAKSRLVTN
jgi:hypothetical protein